MSDLRVLLLGDRDDLLEGDLWRPDDYGPSFWRTNWSDGWPGGALVIARSVTTFGQTQAKMGFEEWHNTPHSPPEAKKGWRRFL